MPIDFESMQKALKQVELFEFNIRPLMEEGKYIEDVVDIDELLGLLGRVIDLKDQSTILTNLKVRVEARLNTNPKLEECLELYHHLPQYSEAERIVGARIERLLKEAIASFSSVDAAILAFEDELNDMTFFHAMFMRLLGERFFSKEG